MQPPGSFTAAARLRLAALWGEGPDGRILAIGDGIQPDIKGAADEGIDSLVITGGLAAAETATKVQPDAAKLDAYLARESQSPAYSIGFLR